MSNKTANYQLTLHDCLEAQQLHERNKKGLWMEIAIIVLCVFQITVGLVRFQIPDFLIIEKFNFHYGQSTDELYTLIWVYSLCFLAFFGRIFPKFNPFAYWTTKKNLQKNFVKIESKQISITSEGITISSQNFCEHHQWQAITKTAENKKILLLYYHSRDRQFIVIPKRLFNSEAELNNFRHLLNN